MTVEKAKVHDAQAIKALLDAFSKKGLLLPLGLEDIFQNILGFAVAKDKTAGTVGCVNLTVFDGQLAEIRSLAVSPSSQNKGVGAALIQYALKWAEAIGIPKVFALTYAEGFFRKMGFERHHKTELPHKIWKDCVNCPKFPNCDEVLFVKSPKEEAI